MFFLKNITKKDTTIKDKYHWVGKKQLMTSKNLPKMPNLAKNQSVSIKNIFIEETY
jgi:hypothetical protein